MSTDLGMIDTFGRVTRDLRVSLTDRCNLRCHYCMPAEGLARLDRRDVLTFDEVVRLVSIATSRLGITSVRFTGGEPLLRADLTDIVDAVAQLPHRPEIALTTNALGLTHKAEALSQAGLDRINVSLDTVDRERFAAITRRDRFDDVISGLSAARAAGLSPIKVNAVLSPNGGLDDTLGLVDYCLEHDYQLRIIEHMPLDADHQWAREKMITADQVLARLEAELAERDHYLVPDAAPRGSAPAQTWVVCDDDGAPRGKVGIIASVTRPFCGDCDRTRITADGKIRTCLFSESETDLMALLRDGSSDDAIADRWRIATWGKLAGHGINDPGYVQPTRTMSAIGG